MAPSKQGVIEVIDDIVKRGPDLSIDEIERKLRLLRRGPQAPSTHAAITFLECLLERKRQRATPARGRYEQAGSSAA